MADLRDKLRAQSVALRAVNRGDLLREPCLFCDTLPVHAHHHDYTKPLDVTWLCPRHHKLAHMSEDRLSGNSTLTRKRRPAREPDETTAAILRMIRALGVQVGQGDPSELRLLLKVDAEIAAAYVAAIAGMRQSGFTDIDIGATLGVSRQAVQQRWPR